jgi:hypothetical protein
MEALFSAKHHVPERSYQEKLNGISFIEILVQPDF